MQKKHQSKQNIQKTAGKIFISHATKDHEVASKFCDTILGNVLNISTQEIFNTSHQGTKPKTGEDFKNRIKDEMINAKVVFQFISAAYKESEACLIEMGAAWVLSNNVKPLIVEKGSYDVGFIHSSTQQALLHSEEHLIKLLDELQEEEIFNGQVKSAVLVRKVKEFVNWLNDYDQKTNSVANNSIQEKPSKLTIHSARKKNVPTEADAKMITNYLDSKKYTKITFEGIRKYVHPKFTDKFIFALVEKFPDDITRTQIKGQSGIQNLWPDSNF